MAGLEHKRIKQEEPHHKGDTKHCKNNIQKSRFGEELIFIWTDQEDKYPRNRGYFIGNKFG